MLPTVVRAAGWQICLQDFNSQTAPACDGEGDSRCSAVATCLGPLASGRAGEPAGLAPLVLPPGAAVAGAAAEGDASCRAYCPRVGVTCGPAGLP